MTHPYRALFNVPGATAFVLAGLIARVAMPMMGIGIITMLAQLRGSYALAGAVSGTFVLTYALLSPQVSRHVDRLGQGRVLPVATLISVVGVSILLLATWWPAPDWTLFVGACLTGFMPSLPAMVRARWTAIFRGQPQLQTAYALETVLDELSFIAGPPLAIGLSVMTFAQAGPLAAAVLLAIGTAWLVCQRATQPAIVEVIAGTRSVLHRGSVRLLALLMVAMGMIVGTVDIVSVAFAEQAGQPAGASLVLSAYALGACLAGLLFGAWQLSLPLHRLLVLGGLATAATTLPMLLATDLPMLAGAVFVAGLFFAPTMIVAMSLIEREVPEQQLTEGMTWLLAGLNAGVALGAVLSGQIVDAAGASAGFKVALIASMAVLVLSVWVSRHLACHNSMATPSTGQPTPGNHTDQRGA